MNVGGGMASVDDGPARGGGTVAVALELEGVAGRAYFP